LYKSETRCFNSSYPPLRGKGGAGGGGGNGGFGKPLITSFGVGGRCGAGGGGGTGTTTVPLSPSVVTVTGVPLTDLLSTVTSSFLLFSFVHDITASVNATENNARIFFIK
jgi:hypothetical protein